MNPSIVKNIAAVFPRRRKASQPTNSNSSFVANLPPGQSVGVRELIGLIAGSGNFPFEFIRAAQAAGKSVVACCHQGETDPKLIPLLDDHCWVKVGELGRMIRFFQERNVREVAMAGGINRVRLFGGVKLDARGMALIMRIRSSKDDLILRGIADEFAKDGLEVVECTRYLTESLTPLGLLTRKTLSEQEQRDIRVGIDAIKAMSSEHIGQLVVVREGVIVAVEAVEGSDAAITRGGELGGKGAVVVKFAKLSQDMRFDVPTVGLRTIATMQKVGARVLALEAGRTLMIDREDTISEANRLGISIVGCDPLTST